MNDYYGILGVSRDSSEADIKKAYRQLARKLHPDVAGAEHADEERFKQVQNAYEVLSNAEKRAMYDQGIDPLSPNSNMGGNPFGGFNFNFSNINDIFDMFGGHAGGQRQTRDPSQGKDVLKRLKITLPEAIFGAKKEITVNLAVGCNVCDSTGSKSKTPPHTCGTCHGQGVVLTVQRTVFGQMQSQATCPECHGIGSVIADPCDNCGGQGIMMSREKIEVTLPKGVHSGNRVFYEGKGNKGPNGGKTGDLYVEIEVREHEIFAVNNSDLICKLEVPLTTALLGGEVSVNTLDGEQKVTLNESTQFGTVAKIPGLGFPTAVRSDTRGDLRVFIEIVFPTKLNSKERDLITKLSVQSKDHKFNYKLENIQEGGFFNKLKKVFS